LVQGWFAAYFARMSLLDEQAVYGQFTVLLNARTKPLSMAEKATHKGDHTLQIDS
jgi:hypothetical protein